MADQTGASKAFDKVQFGLEGSHGSAVAADTVLLAQVGVPKDRTPQFPQEAIGVRARSFRSAIYQISADPIPLAIEHGYFQALPILFSMATKGGVSSAEQNADQDDYLWDHTPALDATDNAQDSVTLEVGDNLQAYEIEYCLARRLRLGGVLGADAPVKIEAELFGKQVSPTTFTGALSLPAVEPMVANLTEIYIDALWANVGNTQKTGLLREWDAEIITGLHPQFHGDSKMMTGHAQGFFDLALRLTTEGITDADTLFDGFQALTEYAIRIQVLGTQLGSGDVHTFTLDVFGAFSEAVPRGQVSEDDNLHTFIFYPYYDDTGAALFNLSCITDVETI